MSKPLECQVLVGGSGHPTDDGSLFVLELKPKGFDFHNAENEEDFQINQVANSVPELREYLQSGKDVFYGEQNWFYIDDEMEKTMVKPLPAPFNDVNAVVDLCWKLEDVMYDETAQLILNLYDKAFTQLELDKLSVDELKAVIAIKSREQDSGPSRGAYSNKPELIDMILLDQKSKGLKAIRVEQMKLF